MKRSLLTLTLAFMITLICKGVTNPELIYYQSDYRNTTVIKPLGDWTCRGSGKKAQNVEIGESGIMLNSLFPDGSRAYIPMNFEDFGMVYISNSTTEEGGAADEWLISPAINLSDAPDDIILGFDIFAYGNNNSPKYEVYVSTIGCEPKDFTTPIYTGKASNNASYPVCERKYLPLKGVTGEQVYIAFVNKSRNAQILGFKDISISEYELDMVNTTETFFIEPQDVTISISVGALTPVPCNGFTAVLDVDGDLQEEHTSTPLSVSYMQTKIDFPKPISLEMDKNINYTITITPNYEGATPSVFHGSVACSEGFDPVCVMEETTATWCGYCVRGNVAMNMFKDIYGDQFIGIAVHGSNDPMHLPTYLDPLLAQSNITGFPSAWYNRSRQEDPLTPELVKELLSERSGYAIDIKEVTIDHGANNLMTVRYAPRLAFSTSGADITAVAVITEDDVKGNDNSWSQTNYFSGVTQMDVDSSFGVGTWEYFKEYSELGSTIPYPLIRYNHVARGIFNTYTGGGEGAELPGVWEANKEQEFTLSFEMPMMDNVGTSGVQNWENTNIVVLLLDNASGKVLTAAEIGAADYMECSVHQMGFAGNVDVDRQGDRIIIRAEADIHINIYNPQGYCLHSADAAEGSVEVDAADFCGPVIVRVASGNDVYVKKLIF